MKKEPKEKVIPLPEREPDHKKGYPEPDDDTEDEPGQNVNAKQS